VSFAFSRSAAAITLEDWPDPISITRRGLKWRSTQCTAAAHPKLNELFSV